MSTRIVLMALAASLLASCAHHRASSPSADAPWVPCSTAGSSARCDIRVVRDASGPYSCALGRFRVEPDFLALTGGRPVNIQWELPERLVFCDRDGVSLKPGWSFAQREVLESYGSDSKDGAHPGFGASGTCKKFRNWRWGNTSPGVAHAYEIRFRDSQSDQQCTIDPWVKNG